MAYPFQNQAIRSRSCILLICLCTVLLAASVSGESYSEDYEGYLGETIALHGSSYNSAQIYLFMTGPGLPENGVPLLDTSKRADQGDFTMVDVGSDQQWSYKWDTSRLENQIDPGTYIVYAVNAPADKSSLTGHSYQTLSVYLKDGKLSKDRVSIGTKYTLNLADDDPVTTAPVTTSPPTPLPTTIVPETTVTTAVPTPPPTQKSTVPPVAAIAGVMVVGCVHLFSRKD